MRNLRRKALSLSTIKDQPVHITKNISYILGALRDGSVCKYEDRHGKKHHVLTIYNSDVGWLEILRGMFKNTFDVEPKLIIRNSYTPYIRVYSKKLVYIISRYYNHPLGSQINWQTPIPIKKSNEPGIWREYIAGFFDSEGGVDILREQLKFHLSWNGIVCHPLVDIKNSLARFFGIECGNVCMYQNARGNYPRFVLRIRKKDNRKFVLQIPVRNPSKIKKIQSITPERSQPQDSSPAEEGGPEN